MVRVVALAAVVVLSVSATAGAADFDAGAPGPAISPGLWRGHFSGGTNVAPPSQDIVVAWTDEVAFFPDQGSCTRWIRDRRAHVKPYQGFTGCLRIR